MGRKCKLQDLGTYGDTDNAYQAPNRKYYSCKSAYDLIVRNQTYRGECISQMYDVLGYKDFMKIPGYFYHKLKEWEPYGYDVVLRDIKNKSKDIEWALNNKSFPQETAKIMYICAILENGINDAMKELVAERKVESKEFSDLDNSVQMTVQKTKNISKWLEE